MPFIMASLWFYQGYTFELTKAVSDNLLNMINAVYREKAFDFLSGL